MSRTLFPLIASILLLYGCATVKPPAPYGPCPTPAQLRWQRMETNMFCHFGPNTFSGLEWGEGTEPEDIFNPTALDCRQWAATAKAAGMKGVILTAKHHDGFCLWPNPASTHTVAYSQWRNGQGDVLRDLSQACREAGVKMGVYISPWDRNAPDYGTPAYNAITRHSAKPCIMHSATTATSSSSGLTEPTVKARPGANSSMIGHSSMPPLPSSSPRL